MLSHKFIFQKSKIFTSDNEIWITPTVPINHHSIPRNQRNRSRVLYHYPMLMYSRLKQPALNTLIFSSKTTNDLSFPLICNSFAGLVGQERWLSSTVRAVPHIQTQCWTFLRMLDSKRSQNPERLSDAMQPLKSIDTRVNRGKQS